jgi:hypothetical protein
MGDVTATDTECDNVLHRASPRQIRAIEILIGGGTHSEAADAAGVHRITVTRWVNHHPAVIAELNGALLEARTRYRFVVSRLMEKSMRVVEEALDKNDRAAAFRWYALNPHHHAAQIGPVEPMAVVEQVRRAMPTFLEEIAASGDRSTADAEAKIRSLFIESD